MKFETLINNRKILLGIVIVFVIILTLIISATLAKYKVTESINIASGTINYSPSDFNLMGIYLENDNGYTQTDTIPESGYVLNETESYCKQEDTELDVTISYNISSKMLTISPMTSKGTKCYLYFDEAKLCPDGAIACNNIMSNMNAILERTSFDNVLTEETIKTIYITEDNDGTSYYYAGATADNYLEFAGFYWRIIRINGDGTIRLIYSGNKIDATGEDLAIGSSAFGSSEDDNAYVGYMYTSGNVHGYGTSSVVKGVLDNWYVANLNNYTNYISYEAGFCNDRQPSTDPAALNGSGGTGTTTTYYGAYIRLETNGIPSNKCVNSNDLFTTSSSTKGNKALAYPIGLITADEVAYARGSVSGTNYYYYGYSGKEYWTITPYMFESIGPMTYIVTAMGGIYYEYGYTGGTYIRPVINLRADITLTGSGISTDPYEVS